MDVVPVASSIHEHVGLVVPVDTDEPAHRLRAPVSLQVPRAPSGDSGHISPVHLGGSEHKLIGSVNMNDEHHILTTAGGQRAAQLKASLAPKPRFSHIMNDYVGACFEDNCNIGKDSMLFLS